jgi:hypothetical protein
MLADVTPPAGAEPQPVDDAEVVDAVPVTDSAADRLALAPMVRRTGELVAATPVAVHAAAVAVTGFAAGAVTVAAVKRGRRRRAQRFRRKGLGEIRATHSFLVDIHLLSRD